ncbi:MAG: hypothetical protein S4CHLAM45_00350 [Chlamydiales bacterium]|nr:hypothetical protein [Chlamydiales bacterium]MCH9619359.1 hypothetical protein [Chlamydiales bacterium]MCH9622163.1 hypothetical protein [Chlamydiales bacterium]
MGSLVNPRVVLNVDHLLVAETHQLRPDQTKFFIQNRLVVYAAGIPHFVPPGVYGFLKHLFGEGGVAHKDIAFFNDGPYGRTKELVGQLLKRALGKEIEVKILGAESLEKDLSEQKIRGQKRLYNVFSDRVGSKNLVKVFGDEFVSDTVLVGHRFGVIYPSQERNFIYVPPSKIADFSAEGEEEKINLAANRIYYLAGFLFPLLEECKMNGTSVSEAAFEAQFKDNGKREGCCYINRYEERTSDSNLYEIGLEWLQTTDPTLSFHSHRAYTASISKGWTPEDLVELNSLITVLAPSQGNRAGKRKQRV